MIKLEENKIKDLIISAIRVRANAYAPYSKFRVGAALLGTDGCIYTGCNIENASYPVGLCAERSAFASAISKGCRTFRAIAIVGGPEDSPLADCPPCGMCRQFMREFCDSTFPVILATSATEYRILTLGELLPESFGPDTMTS